MLQMGAFQCYKWEHFNVTIRSILVLSVGAFWHYQCERSGVISVSVLVLPMGAFRVISRNIPMLSIV